MTITKADRHLALLLMVENDNPDSPANRIGRACGDAAAALRNPFLLGERERESLAQLLQAQAEQLTSESFQLEDYDRDLFGRVSRKLAAVEDDLPPALLAQSDLGAAAFAPLVAAITRAISAEVSARVGEAQ